MSHRVDGPRGCPENPMSNAQLRDKFIACASLANPPIGEHEASQLAQCVLTLEQTSDAARTIQKSIAA
jgi:hypothetical protein